MRDPLRAMDRIWLPVLRGRGIDPDASSRWVSVGHSHPYGEDGKMSRSWGEGSECGFILALSSFG